MLCDQAWGGVQARLGLSGRELQIIKAVFDGRPERAIAVHLGISPHTVHTHMERLYHKLAVSDRVGLVLHVLSAYLPMRDSIFVTTRGPRHQLH
jgi:DNA-binding CsgD family transcriptional regulator